MWNVEHELFNSLKIGTKLNSVTLKNWDNMENETSWKMKHLQLKNHGK